MGVGVGVVIGFIGIFILGIAIIIQIVVATKQTDTTYKRLLEVAIIIGSIAAVIYIGSIILTAYYSGKELAEEGGKYTGEGGKFVEEHPQLLELAAA